MTLVSWKLLENIANRIFSLLPFLPVCDKVQSPHFTTHLISGDFINVSFPGRVCSFTGSCLSQQLRTFCFTGLIFLLCFPIHPSSFILWPIFALAFFFPSVEEESGVLLWAGKREGNGRLGG